MTFNAQSPFLITTRKFPEDPLELQAVLTKSYIDTAQAINARTIGLFESIQIITGNRYFNTGSPENRKQSFRKVFPFGAIAAGATLTIDHGITGITQFVNSYGECITSTPDFRCIPYASATVVTQQIEVRKTSTQIIITNGATAPNITSGIFILEYLLN